jgi:rubrerythrin
MDQETPALTAPAVDPNALLHVQVRSVLMRVQKALAELKLQPSEAYRVKTAREDVDYAIKRLEDALDVKSDRWKCSSCGHVAVFSRPVVKSAAGRCTRCGKSEFEPDSSHP